MHRAVQMISRPPASCTASAPSRAQADTPPFAQPTRTLGVSMIRMRTVRTMLLVGGLLALVLLVHHLGAASIAAALAHITWWQFVLITLFHVFNLVVDSAAWRYAFPREAAPFPRLVAA